MNTKNTTLTVPSGGNSGGAHTVGEVMELIDEYCELKAQFWMAQANPVQRIDHLKRIERIAARKALLAAITKLVDAHDCDRAILLSRTVVMDKAIAD